ncbi:MAG: hypothetical protein WBV95_14800 [Desulfobacterales bacterium]
MFHAGKWNFVNGRSRNQPTATPLVVRLMAAGRCGPDHPPPLQADRPGCGAETLTPACGNLDARRIG